MSDDIAADFEIAGTEIRHVRGTTVYSVLQLHRWLQDWLDGTVDSTELEVSSTEWEVSRRTTDHYIELLPPYTLADGAERFLDGGALKVGDELYASDIEFGFVDDS